MGCTASSADSPKVRYLPEEECKHEALLALDSITRGDTDGGLDRLAELLKLASTNTAAVQIVLVVIGSLAKDEAMRVPLYLTPGIVDGLVMYKIPSPTNTDIDTQSLALEAFTDVTKKPPSQHNTFTPTEKKVMTGLAAVGTVIAGAMLFPVAAPAVAANLGFASSSSLLAWLGGGTIASGGLGMAGGTAVVSAGVAGMGAAAGAAVNGNIRARSANARDRVAFISYYQAEGKELAENIFKFLTKKWNDDLIFLDKDVAHQTSITTNDIVSYVRKTDNLIVVLTPSYHTRPWCLVEVVAAAEFGVNILPLRVVGQANDAKFDFGALSIALESDRALAAYIGKKVCQELHELGFSAQRVRTALNIMKEKWVPDANPSVDSEVQKALKGLQERMRV